MNSTLTNLVKAFIGESQVRNRYTLYAKTAIKEGYVQISNVFLETAEQERQHAKWVYTLLNEIKKDDKPIKVETEAPTVLGDTAANLTAAAEGENYEHTEMYPEFAKTAEKEGLDAIAKRLKSISIAEKHHEERFLKFLEQVEKGTVHKKSKPTWWVCLECGYMVYAPEPPEECPSCDHSSAYFQVMCEEY